MSETLLNHIVSGLKEAAANTRFSKAVVGLSGGIDSAVAAAIAVRALGEENVFPYFLPYKHSNLQSFSDARLTADHLKLPLREMDITPFADPYIRSQEGITLLRAGNILARIRMMILFDQSALHGAFVLGTGNKSEILLGYMTWHGDSASSINPLGELYKTEVWALAGQLGLPERLIAKAPSADLMAGQTDEGDLGFRYTEVDQLLTVLADEGVTPAEAVRRGFPESFVKKVIHRISVNEFKRRLPVIISRNGVR